MTTSQGFAFGLLVGLTLGGLIGAAYARVRRAVNDYRLTRKAVRDSARSAWANVKAAALLMGAGGLAVVIAYASMRGGK